MEALVSSNQEAKSEGYIDLMQDMKCKSFAIYNT